MNVVFTSSAERARGAINRVKPELAGALDELLRAVTSAAGRGELERGGDVRLPLEAPVAFRPGFPGARIVALEAEVRPAGAAYEVVWVTLVLVGGAGGHYPRRPSEVG